MEALCDIACSGGGGGRGRGPPGPWAAPGRHAVRTAGELPRRVLVVDDERDLADMAAALLCACGLEARVAYSAFDAVRILASEGDIDAVFSDVMMPGMTGLQLADTIRELYPAMKVVLTSGFTAPALMAHHRSYPYTAKPYRIEAVLALLRG